jgi:hypothetical protein
MLDSQDVYRRLYLSAEVKTSTVDVVNTNDLNNQGERIVSTLDAP